MPTPSGRGAALAFLVAISAGCVSAPSPSPVDPSAPASPAKPTTAAVVVATPAASALGTPTPAPATAATRVAALPADDAVAATTYSPGGIAIDASGTMYVSDCGAARVYRIVDKQTVAVVAGSGPGGFDAGFRGDGGPATRAQVQCPYGLATDATGALYIADHGNSRIRRVGPDGMIETIAGSSHPGSGWGSFGGDGGPATRARLNNPTNIAFGPDGTLYVADRDNDRIRSIAPDGTIATVAGTTGGFGGDGGPATAARIDDPAGISVAPDGTIFFADSNNERIRRIDHDGTITTIAGTGKNASKGDNGPAIKASLADPEAILLDPAGDLFIAEGDADRVRVITPDGTIWALAGTGKAGNAGDGGPATDAELDGVGAPGALAMDKEWRLYISMSDRIRVVQPSGTIGTFEVGHP